MPAKLKSRGLEPMQMVSVPIFILGEHPSLIKRSIADLYAANADKEHLGRSIADLNDQIRARAAHEGELAAPRSKANWVR